MSDLILPTDEQPGTPNNVNNVMANDEAIRDYVNGPGNIDDTKLTSTTNPIWRNVFQIRGVPVFNGQSGGSYIVSTTTMDPLTTGAASAPIWIPSAADVSVNGKTTQGRLAAYFAVNGVSPGITFTFGLNNVLTAFGGSGQLGYSVAAPNSTVAFVNPAGGSAGSAVSAPFNFSGLGSGGLYIFTVFLSGAPATLSTVTFSIALQIRHV